jgi:hypothetical protein
MAPDSDENDLSAGISLERFSIGIGDRFGREGVAQLAALEAARRDGIAVTPVWNKSNRDVLVKTGAGLHLKTAGTTWLEEVVGLALSGGEGLAFVKEIWGLALDRREDLAKPYATVIDIDPARLPSAAEVSDWDGPRFAAALRHDPACPHFNPHLRQLLHVAFRLAAEAGARYLALLDANRAIVAHEVTINLLDRHIKRLFFRS